MSNTALITGGAKRIGREIALYLSQNQYAIALHYNTSEDDARKVARRIEQNGAACALFRCDLSDFSSVSKLIPAVFKKFPDCNLLIHNASVFTRAHLLETDEELFDRHFTVNFKAPFFLSQQFAKRCRKGHIITMLDTKINKNDTPYFTYSLTKKALHEFTKMAALELGPDIRVNGICPGLILPSEYTDEKSFNRMAGKIPLKATGNPERVVSAISFLLDNPFITGECIFVDGGEHLV